MNIQYPRLELYTLVSKDNIDNIVEIIKKLENEHHQFTYTHGLMDNIDDIHQFTITDNIHSFNKELFRLSKHYISNLDYSQINIITNINDCYKCYSLTDKTVTYRRDLYNYIVSELEDLFKLSLYDLYIP